MDITDDIRSSAGNLDDLYRDVGPRLLAYFARRHGDSHLAEDLLQETFAAALRRPHQLTDLPSPRAYLFVIARNLSVDVYRRSRPAAELPPELEAQEPDLRDPRLDAMRTAIGGLNAGLREVLEFRLEQELSYEEIAAVLEIPIGTVRSRLHQAVKQLRRAMARTSVGALKGIDYES